MSDSELLPLRSASLGGSALSRAMQSGETPEGWAVRAPSGVARWRAHAAEVRDTHTGWLDAIREAFGDAPHGAASLRLLEAAARGLVVTTGQQPGLFGGPVYTISKALSARAMADVLSESLNVPVAPVFWAATDDADWHEAATTYVLGSQGLEQLSLSGDPTDGIPLADVPLGDLSQQLDALRAACGSLADPRPLQLLESCFKADASIGEAYVAWLRGLLEPLGVSVLDASHPALRAAADPFLRTALVQATAIDHALIARDGDITQAGFKPQVERVDGLSAVFVMRAGVRTRVPIAEAAAVAKEAPVGSLGANVLLRPVVERSLLPTAAYVAGPGELAYFAQVSAVSAALSLPAPLAVPRWGMSWTEPHVARALERLGADAEAMQDPHAVAERLARAAMDREIADALERLRNTLETQLSVLSHAVESSDIVVPDAVLTGIQRDLDHKLTRFERRLLAAIKRQDSATARDIRVASAALYPAGSLPERTFCIVPLLSRYGLRVLDEMVLLATEHARALVKGGVVPTE